MFRFVKGISKVFQLLIFKSLRIDTIKYFDLYMFGWIYTFFNIVVGAIYLMKGEYALANVMLACGIISFACLVYIGRAVGTIIPPSSELVDINIKLDAQSTLLLAGLIRQGVKYRGENAIILTAQGDEVANSIAANIETAAAVHLSKRREMK